MLQVFCGQRDKLPVQAVEIVVSDAGEPVASVELGDLSDSKVFSHTHCLSSLVNDFVKEERSVAINVVHFRLEEVTRPLFFRNFLSLLSFYMLT